MGSLSTNGVKAIRIYSDEPYKINGVGNSAIMPRGVTAVAEGVTSFDFTNTITVEIMRAIMTPDENLNALPAFAPTEIRVV